MGRREEFGVVRQVATNFLLLNIGDVIGKAGLFAATIYLAKTLGVEGYGVFSFIQSCILLLTFSTDLGLEWRGVDYIARHRSSPDFGYRLSSYVNQVFSVRLTLALIAYAALALLCAFIPMLRAHVPLSLGFGLSVFISAVLADWVYTGLGQIPELVLSRILRAGIYLVLVVVAVKAKRDLWVAGALYSAAFSMAAVFLLGSLHRKYGWRLAVGFRTSSVWHSLSGALPFFLYGLLAQLFYLLGTLLVECLQGAHATGLYSAAYRVVAALLALGTYLISASYPYIADTVASDRPSINVRKLLSILLAKVLLFSLMAVGGGLLLSNRLIALFYGAEYTESAGLLRWLVISVPFVLVSLMLGAFLNVLQREKEVMIIIIGASTATLLIAPLAIRHIGVDGAAASILVGTIVCSLSSAAALLRALSKRAQAMSGTSLLQGPDDAVSSIDH